MKAYHFTAAHLLGGCLEEGLTLGRVPLFDEVGNAFLAEGWQWLTVNPAWYQAWDAWGTLPYPRNAHRLTIKIPKAHTWRVWDWRRVVPGHMAEVLGSRGDPENWLLFRGRIKPAWIAQVDNCPPLFKRERGPAWAIN